MTTKREMTIPELISFTKTWHSKPYPFISPTRPSLSAAGKNIIITGGGTGIGKAIAIAFAQAGAASISILGRRLDRLQTAVGEITAAATNPKTRVLFETADVAQRVDIDRALKSITDQVGKIDVFVSNAGIMPAQGPVAGYDVDEFRHGFELNVVGAFNAVQAFLPLAAKDAQLFNISSGIGHIAPFADTFTYAVNKAAIIKLFDYVAAEHPELHVVQVQPGVVATEINSGTDIHVEAPDEQLPGAFLVWLASPEAKFLKGKFVWVNWDAEELISRAKEIESSMLLRVLLNGVPM